MSLRSHLQRRLWDPIHPHHLFIAWPWGHFALPWTPCHFVLPHHHSLQTKPMQGTTYPGLETLNYQPKQTFSSYKLITSLIVTVTESWPTQVFPSSWPQTLCLSPFSNSLKYKSDRPFEPVNSTWCCLPALLLSREAHVPVYFFQRLCSPSSGIVCPFLCVMFSVHSGQTQGHFNRRNYFPLGFRSKSFHSECRSLLSCYSSLTFHCNSQRKENHCVLDMFSIFTIGGGLNVFRILT